MSWKGDELAKQLQSGLLEVPGLNLPTELDTKEQAPPPPELQVLIYCAADQMVRVPIAVACLELRIA